MTEPKSPREIAEELAALIGRLEKDEPSYITTKAEDETIAFLKRNGRNFLSYAAERERLLVTALEFYAQREWANGYPGGVYADDTHTILDFGDTAREALKSRLRSRPATEGKGDD